MPVTEADVAHVHRAFTEFNARFDDLRAGDLQAYHEEFYAPDGVLHNADGFPVDATYEGWDGYQRWFQESYGPYEGVQWGIDSVEAAGERVVAVARSGGRAIGDPTWLEIRLAMVYALRDGRIARVDVFLTPEAAFDYARAQG